MSASWNGVRSQLGLLVTSVLALAMATCMATPPSAPSGTEVVSFRTQISALASGLEVVVEQDDSTGLVGAVLVVGAGSADDPPGEEGLAHVVEHLAFRSKNPGEPSAWPELNRLGAVAWNGTTSREATTYYAFVSREHAVELLRLFSRIAEDPLRGVDQATLDRERAVVRNELRLSQENGAPGEAEAWLDQAMFPATHPYSRPVVGTHESLSRITLDDARRFVTDHYRPSRMTLLVAGPAVRQPDVVAALSPKLRGDGISVRVPPEPKLPAVIAAPPRVERTPIAERQSAVHNPEVWIGWSLPSIYGGDGAAVQLVGNFATVVSSELRRNHSDAIFATTTLETDARASIFLCRVSLQRGTDPEAAARVAIQQIRDSLKRAADPYSFIHTRQAVLTTMAFDTEDILSRANAMAQWAHFTGDPQFFHRRVAELEAAERSRTARLGLEYIDTDTAHVLFVKPLPAEARAVGSGGLEKSVADEERLSIGHIDRSAVLGAAISPGLRSAFRSRLANGLELIVVPRRGSPFRTALLGFHGGETANAPPGVVEVVARSSADTVTAPLEMHGITTTKLERIDAAYEQVRSSSEDLGTVLDVLYKRRIRVISGWPTSAFEQQELPLLTQQERAADAVALRRFDLTFVPSRAYRPLGTEIAAVTNAEARERMQAFRRPENAAVIVVGDEDPARVLSEVKSFFGSWEGTRHKPARFALPPREHIDVPVDQRILVAHRPGATQTEIHVGCLLPPLGGDHTAVYDVFSNALQQRLVRELRWKSGLTYDVNADLSSTADGGAWINVRTDVENPRLTEALTILRRELQRIQPEPDEIDTARWELIRAYNLRFRTSASIADEVYTAWNRHWPLEWIDDYPYALANLVQSDLTPLETRCRDNTVLLLIGDEPTIRVALATPAR